MFTLDHLRIDTPSLRLGFYLVPWDSQIFGHAVAQIELLELGDGDASAAFSEFDAWCEAQGVAFTACRLNHQQLREIAWIGQRGFRFVEAMIYPRFDDLDRIGQTEVGSTLVISEVSSSDIDSIQAIAAEAFVTSRFLIDPWIDPKLGAKRYRTWVANSFADPAHLVLKASVGDSIAGFFIVEERADGSIYWHLTAVAPAFQGRGFGKALWLRMMHWHRERGSRRVDTAISAHNLPVLGLYGALGFRMRASAVTFHRGELRLAACCPP